MTATAITTTLQLNMKNTERATVMPLWFMVFGGTVPIGNLVFGVVIEWIGARAVLGFGAAFAIFLAWWVDLRRLPPEAFLPEADGGEPMTPTNASACLAPSEFGDDPLEAGGPARLHQHDDAGAEVADRRSDVVGRLDAVEVGADRDQLDPERRASSAIRTVRRLGIVDLAHQPEHRDPPVGVASRRARRAPRASTSGLAL